MAVAVKELNVILAGVGGQGVVLMSEILGSAAVRDGYKVRGSEVLGMAQRGGPVFSNIRLGTDVESPLTSEGRCDIMVALEPSEALRYIQYLSKKSTVIINLQKIIPASVSLGKSTYPELELIKDRLQAIAGKVIAVDAADLADKAGNRQSTNVVMLGTLFSCENMPISVETVQECISEHVPAKAKNVNMKAFDLGRQACQSQLHYSVR